MEPELQTHSTHKRNALIFVAFGLVVLSIGVAGLAKGYRSLSYAEALGTVTSSALVDSIEGASAPLAVETKVEFRVGNRVFHATTPPSDRIWGAERAKLAKHLKREGETTSVWYDPDDPSKSTLIRPVIPRQAPRRSLFTVVGALFLGIGLSFAYSGKKEGDDFPTTTIHRGHGAAGSATAGDRATGWTLIAIPFATTGFAVLCLFGLLGFAMYQGVGGSNWDPIDRVEAHDSRSFSIGCTSDKNGAVRLVAAHEFKKPETVRLWKIEVVATMSVDGRPPIQRTSMPFTGREPSRDSRGAKSIYGDQPHYSDLSGTVTVPFGIVPAASKCSIAGHYTMPRGILPSHIEVKTQKRPIE